MQKIALLILMVSGISLLMSCNKCETCDIYDENGLQIGIGEFCGKELKDAKKDTDTYKCE